MLGSLSGLPVNTAVSVRRGKRGAALVPNESNLSFVSSLAIIKFMASFLKEKYNKEIVPVLREKFEIKNVMAVPKILKVSLNSGIGKYLKEIHNEEQLLFLEEADKFRAMVKK